jgi:antitoxin component YwqK of YwqJK toxin-antitoxin module
MENTQVCFLCQDESSNENEFAQENICACKGSNRIHKSCFNLLKDKQKCCICKNDYTINANAYRKRVESQEFMEEIWVNGSKAEYFVDKNSMKQGTLKVFYHTGDLWMTEEYKNDKLNGIRKIFSPNQKKCRIQKFENNLLIEDSKNFDVI